MRGQSYLKYLMDELIPMRDAGWMKFTHRFIAFYLLLAVANEVVWRGWGTDTWVNFRTFVLPGGQLPLHHGAGPALPALRAGRRRRQGLIPPAALRSFLGAAMSFGTKLSCGCFTLAISLRGPSERPRHQEPGGLR